MGPVPCTNTHCDVTDLLNHGIPIKIQKSEYLVNVTFLQIKKMLNLRVTTGCPISSHSL